MNVIKTNYLRGLNLSDEFTGLIPSVSGEINSGCHLYIGLADESNNIVVKNLSGDEITFRNVLPGIILPFIVTEIVSSSGNVRGVVALW
jgi:hypothetical protein